MELAISGVGRCHPGRGLKDSGDGETIEVGFFVGDPFLDRLPRWFDRLHGVDVEGRRRRAPAGVVALRGPGSRRHVIGSDGAEVAGGLSACNKNPGWLSPSGVFCIQESRPGIHLIDIFESCEDGFNLVEVASRGHFDARNHPPGNPAVDGSRADRQALREFLFLNEGWFNGIHGYAALVEHAGFELRVQCVTNRVWNRDGFLDGAGHRGRVVKIS